MNFLAPQVASYNTVGSSPKSQPSEVFVMDDAQQQQQQQQKVTTHIVHGWGHEVSVCE